MVSPNLSIKIFILLFLNASMLLSQKGETASINLLFVGDVMAHDSQLEAATIIKNKSYNFDPSFKYISPIIQKADLAIANLEVTLLGKKPYNGFPTFRCPDEMALALRNAGFDMLVTANNHSNDFGRRGILNTLNTVRALGFYQTGTFKDATDRELNYPLVVYKKGFKLAFLNYTYRSNNNNIQSPTLLNKLQDMKQIKKDFEAARQLKPDAIIVLLHWGKEYELEENEYQREVAQQFFEWGADVIVGAHPHVIQPIKEYEINTPTNGSKKVVAAYSLGNFISGQEKKNTDGGLLFEVTLEKNREGLTSIKKHQYIPVWRYIYHSKQQHAYYCLPISNFENASNNPLNMSDYQMRAMNSFAKNMRNHLKKYDSSERFLTFEELN